MSAAGSATIQQEKSSAVSARIISGSVGSLVTALAVTPLEVVKVHLQQQQGNGNGNGKSAAAAATKKKALPKNVSLCPKGCGTFVLNNGLYDCVLAKCSVPYFDQYGNLKRVVEEGPLKKKTLKVPKGSHNNLGTFAMIRRIFVQDGFRGIYAGLGPTLVMGVPSTAFYYTVYDEMVSHARQNPHLVERIDTYIPLFAGSSARLLSTMLTAPLELIRTRQASRVGEGSAPISMVAEFRTICQEEGASALYKGLAPTLWRDVPFSGIYWLCLEQFRNLFAAALKVEKAQETPLQQAGLSFLSGASAGMVAAGFTTPFDVVKTRQQAVSETLETVATRPQQQLAACGCNHDGHMVYRPPELRQRQNASVFAYMRTIYENEGLHGLWRGNQTRMIKVAPSCAIMITCYELGKRMLLD